MQQVDPKSWDRAAALLGDLHPLLEQLGSTEGLVTLSSASEFLRVSQVHDFDSLAAFLRAYQAKLLFPVELPAIQKGHHHAYKNETRELIDLDQEIGRGSIPREFALASARVGRAQLRRLRPLRDERVAQRYLQAVEEGRAHGWHTLVYGLTLALYSVPVRQGLQNYARQTLRGFIHSAAGALHLSESAGEELLDSLCHDVPQRLAALLDDKDESSLHSLS
jgi:urease accessory protein UreF